MAFQLLGVLLLGGLAAADGGFRSVVHVGSGSGRLFTAARAGAPAALTYRARSSNPLAGHNGSVVWWSGSRLALPCSVPSVDRLKLPRRAPLPIDDDQPRRKSYFWMKDGEEISGKRVSQNGTLEVSRRRGSDGDLEGRYQCSARHSAGIVLGIPIYLKNASIEKQFSQHPENRTARVGQPASFSCSIRSVPEASVSWLKDGGSLPNDTRFQILKNQLVITDVKKEDAGLYRCIASNAYANKTRASHRGRLEVEEGEGQVEATWLPLQEERNLTVERGARVVLACPVVAWPRPEIIWKLTPPGGRTGELEATDQVLVLSRAELDQEGVYTCMVAGKSDLVQTFNVTITVPVVIETPPSSQDPFRASTVRLGCTASGKPEPTLTWYKDGKPLVLGESYRLLKSTIDEKIELVISGVTSHDAGVYQCFATNGITTASEWASVTVTGSHAPAPVNVTCAPLSAQSVLLQWAHEKAKHVLAYTVHVAPLDRVGGSSPGQPHTDTQETITLEEPLTPYSIQVRAYVKSASDMSDDVVCQGQGVPIKLRKLPDDAILVSWGNFAEETPGVQQWMVQYKADDGVEKNVTLNGTVTNYTMSVKPDHPLQVRVLGSRTEQWLEQNLTLVPWTPTTSAGDDQDDRITTVEVSDLELTSTSPTAISLRWRCGAAGSAETYSFIVCVRRSGAPERCEQSVKNSATIEELEPDTEYEVRVQARVAGQALGGPFTPPYVMYTLPVESPRFKDITYELLNSTSVRVRWGGHPSLCRVRHTVRLRLPVDVWQAEDVHGNEIVISDIDPDEETYVLVTDLEMLDHSRVLTVPRQKVLAPPVDTKNMIYKYTSEGLKVSWPGAGKFRVRFGQLLTAPMEQWNDINVTTPEVLLTNLDRSKNTYVMVSVFGQAKENKVLTIPPAAEEPFPLYLVVGVACGVVLLGLLLVAALCIWRRRKRNRSSVRSRRQRASADTSEEGAELKDVGGCLANGDAARGAGEPLLNGHVHITENPTIPKTPNGKRKNVNFEAAFDMSRYDDADMTAETTLDTTHDDTHDAHDTRVDDNMNTRVKEVRLQRDDSKPTLQPNG